MFMRFGTMYAAVHSAAVGFYREKYRALTVLTFVAVLTGCGQTAPPLLAGDPADPAAKVAGVGYRSTTAPYTSLRPTVPTSWREQNDRAAPSPKSGQ